MIGKRIYPALMCAVMLCPVWAAGCNKKVDLQKELPVLNYTAPAEGEEIVVITVKDYGEIKIKLFEEELPEACENFKTLAEQGYYDELIFHRVIEDFMVQSGDPRGDGYGGESCWGGKFNGGVNEQIIHLPGVLAYANSTGPASDGSQFYIVTGDAVTDDDLSYYTEKGKVNFTAEAKELYKQHGGAPWLDGGYTAFGQVIDGLDVVYAISHVEVVNPAEKNYKPKDSVYIESVTIEKYDGSQIRWYPSDYDGLQ